VAPSVYRASSGEFANDSYFIDGDTDLRLLLCHRSPASSGARLRKSGPGLQCCASRTGRQRPICGDASEPAHGGTKERHDRGETHYVLGPFGMRRERLAFLSRRSFEKQCASKPFRASSQPIGSRVWGKLGGHGGNVMGTWPAGGERYGDLAGWDPLTKRR
jgi:hypothetical protein